MGFNSAFKVLNTLGWSKVSRYKIGNLESMLDTLPKWTIIKIKGNESEVALDRQHARITVLNYVERT